MAENYYIECPELSLALRDDLCEVTLDVVKGGSSVGFMNPFTLDNAKMFWDSVFEKVKQNKAILAVARDSGSGKVVGTAQLVTDLPPNQIHRADIAKMQVHSSMRQQGVGDALLKFLEKKAIENHKHVLVLDTVTDSPAYRLYLRNGWQIVGEIPDFALYPDGGYCATTYFYKKLEIPTED
jgi:GNAT superfamily N-acetyltransferase